MTTKAGASRHPDLQRLLDARSRQGYGRTVEPAVLDRIAHLARIRTEEVRRAA